MQASRAKSNKKPTIQSYHKVSLLFVGASLLLLIFVLYLSVSKAIIDITPKEKVIAVEVPAWIMMEAGDENEIPGYVFEKELTRSRTFTLPQDSAEPVEAKATGTVSLINESNAPQVLVATTRLMSEEGVLFRLDEAVTVPADGHIDARVSADTSGKSGEIGATRFVIPGLNAERQKAVYAVSVDAMTGGVRYVRPLRQSDIDGAVEEMKKQLVEEVAEEWAAAYDVAIFDGSFSDATISNIKTDVPLETETGVFTLTVDASMRGLAYPQSALRQITESRLLKILDRGERVARVNYDAAEITLKSIDMNQGYAEIVIALDGVSVIDQTHATLAVDQFVNRTAGDVETSLYANELIDGVDVRFIPSWLKRMPTLPDHIEVRIKEIK